MIDFACPLCGNKIQINDIHGGKKGQCSGCGQVISIPLARQSVTRSTPPPPDFLQSNNASAIEEEFDFELNGCEVIDKPKFIQSQWVWLALLGVVIVGVSIGVVMMNSEPTEVSDMSENIPTTSGNGTVPVPVVNIRGNDTAAKLVSAAKPSVSRPQAAMIIKALATLESMAQDDSTRKMLQVHRLLTFARFGERSNALTEMKGDPEPRRVVSMLTMSAMMQARYGNHAEATKSVNDAIAVVLDMPEQGEPSAAQCLTTLAMVCQRAGDQAGAIRAIYAIDKLKGRTSSLSSNELLPASRPSRTYRSRLDVTGLSRKTKKARLMLQIGLVLGGCDKKSDAAKAYRRLIEICGLGSRAEPFALATGISGLIRCGEYNTAAGIVTNLASDQPLRFSLGREIVIAQVKSGDSQGALVNAEAFGNILLLADIRLASGDKSGAIDGYKTVVKILKPLVVTRSSSSIAAKVRNRVKLLVDIAAKQARAGAKADATQTFAKAVNQARGVSYLKTPMELWELIANAQITAGLKPSAFPKTSTHSYGPIDKETAALIGKVEETFGLLPYTRTVAALKPAYLWSFLGLLQLRKGDKTAAEEYYARCMKILQVEPTQNMASSRNLLFNQVVVARVDVGDPKGAAEMIKAYPLIPLRAWTITSIAKAFDDAGDDKSASEILKLLDPKISDYLNSVEVMVYRRFKGGNLIGALKMLPPLKARSVQVGTSLARVFRAACVQKKSELVKPHAAACSMRLLVDLARVTAGSGQTKDAVELLQIGGESQAAAMNSIAKINSIFSIARELAVLGNVDDALAMTTAMTPVLEQYTKGFNRDQTVLRISIATVELLAGETEKA
ncbi:MAG: hypothetical protein HN350_20880, partial [Phycisphaerales bacterium]|nr:hypothetical protein [Phycisphaerales bacterium]